MKLNNKKQFTTDKVLTEDLIYKGIELHKAKLLSKYLENERMYLSEHDILKLPRKETHKPDNRILANYSKYIVDTFGGYYIGTPVKVSHENEEINNFIHDFRVMNDMQDNEYEIAKQCDIFGHSFIYLYQNENNITKVTYESPINMFMVYDNTVEERPLFAVRYSIYNDGSGNGEVLTGDEIITFNFRNKVTFTNRIFHHFNGVPVVEVLENAERQGLFDSVKTLVNALNKAISEKANDVDYFADSYLVIDGVELDDNSAKILRDSRLINLYGNNGTSKAYFLEKPNADNIQEHLIQLLIKLIFDISMISNLSNEDFGASSGTALAFKLQPMNNLANMKDRKLTSAFNQMYKLLFSLPNIKYNELEYLKLEYKFTRNIPRNIKEEAEVVRLLDGQVSNDTKLSILSFVENTKKELEKIHTEDLNNTKIFQEIEKNDRLTDGDLIE